MVLLAVLVIVCVSLLFLIVPLVKNARGNLVIPSVIGKLDDLERREKKALEEVKTLMADHGLGIIPDDEYEKKLHEGRLNVAFLVQEREELETTLSNIDDGIETEILDLRISWGTVDQVGLCTSCSCRIDSKALLCPKCLSFQGESSSGGDKAGEVE